MDADSVRAGKAIGSGAIEVSGWLWEPRKEVGITIGGAFAVFQSVAVGGEEFQPALHASIVLADIGDVFE